MLSRKRASMCIGNSPHVLCMYFGTIIFWDCTLPCRYILMRATAALSGDRGICRDHRQLARLFRLSTCYVRKGWTSGPYGTLNKRIVLSRHILYSYLLPPSATRHRFLDDGRSRDSRERWKTLRTKWEPPSREWILQLASWNLGHRRSCRRPRRRTNGRNRVWRGLSISSQSKIN